MPERTRAARRRSAAATAGALLLATTWATAARAGARDDDPTPALVLVGAWSPGERAAANAALDRIPPEIRARAPHRFARDAAACDADGWPDDDRLAGDDGVIHLCPPRPGATAQDAARRLALALLFGSDAAAGWSAQPAWRRLNRWHPSLVVGLATRADNQDPNGFAEARGRRSPRWDLATFLATLWLDAPGDDGGVGCRLISQARFVRARLHTPAAAQRCAAFEAWADLDHLGDIEVVLAAPSTAMLGSLFGHLFLRLDYRDADPGGAGDDGAVIAAPHLSRTIAFLADNDVPFTEDPAYAIKGIFGRYAASLHERNFLDAYRDYVVLEGRDLRRWRLDLDAAERRTLLERIWTVGHGSRYAYYFFRRNCATLLVDLIDDARARPRTESAPGWLATPPATTLEPWAHGTGDDGDGPPLLRFVPDPIWSFDHQARAASRHRAALEPALTAGLPPATAAAAMRALRDTHAGDEAARARGYERLARLLADGSPVRAADVRDWLRDSATVEMRLSTAANLEREARAERARRERVDRATERAREILARASADFAAARPAPDAAEGDEARQGERAARRELGARLDAAVASVTALDPAARLHGYQSLRDIVSDPAMPAALADRARLLALLQSERRYDVLRMKAVPGLRDALLFTDRDRSIDEQPYLAGQEDLLRLPTETRIAPPLRALQRARQSLFAVRRLALAVDSGPPAAAGAPDPDEGIAARRDYEASLPHSGIDRFAALAGLALGAAPARPGLILAGALYDEQLGDHHRFGFPSDTALVVARSSMFLSAAGGRPFVAAYDARLFGYRSLRTPLPESSGGRWPLGWEVWGDLDGDRARGLATGATLGWGILARLWDGSDLGDHLIGGGALAYHAAFPSNDGGRRDGVAHAVSAPLSLELRAGLGAEPRYRSALAARLWVEPAAVVTGSHSGWAPIYGARVETQLALRAGPRPITDAHDPALVLRAQVVRTPLTFVAETATVALLSVGVDLR